MYVGVLIRIKTRTFNKWNVTKWVLKILLVLFRWVSLFFLSFECSCGDYLHTFSVYILKLLFELSEIWNVCVCTHKRNWPWNQLVPRWHTIYILHRYITRNEHTMVHKYIRELRNKNGRRNVIAPCLGCRLYVLVVYISKWDKYISKLLFSWPTFLL